MSWSQSLSYKPSIIDTNMQESQSQSFIRNNPGYKKTVYTGVQYEMASEHWTEHQRLKE